MSVRLLSDLSRQVVGIVSGEQLMDFFNHTFFVEILKMRVLMHGHRDDICGMPIVALEDSFAVPSDAIL